MLLSGTNCSRKEEKEWKAALDAFRPEIRKNLLNSDRTMNIRIIADVLGVPPTKVFQTEKENCQEGILREDGTANVVK